MNPFVWAAFGAALAWFATIGIADKTFISKAETFGAAIFGANIGGQLQVTLFHAVAPAPDGFQSATLVGALAGAVAMLFVLAVFRKAVGPMRSGKKKPGPR